jgi:hypothetical protein
MGVAEGIRRLGFRRWYERELRDSHGWLVLALLGTIGLLAAFEGLTRADGIDARAGNFAAIGICAVVAVVALRRYLYLLMHAEALAHQAVCAACETYGRLEVCGEERPPRGSGPAGHAGSAQEPGGERLRVRCRRCRHEWTLHA